MNRYIVLYLATLFVIIPIDFLFLGIVAKDFFTLQVGNMLGEIKLVPALLSSTRVAVPDAVARRGNRKIIDYPSEKAAVSQPT